MLPRLTARNKNRFPCAFRPAQIIIISILLACCSFALMGIHAQELLARPVAEASPLSSWYLAEGSTAWEFETNVDIANPNESDVTVRLTYMGHGGIIKAREFDLSATSRTTLNPADDIGSRDFSTKVECLEGKAIAVARRMNWRTFISSSMDMLRYAYGGHSSMGAPATSKTWFMPEGSSAWGFDSWLLVLNPNDSAADVTVTYMREGAGPRSVTRTIASYSRASFRMSDDIGPADASTKVDSTLPVVAERSMYNSKRWEGSCSVGATATSTTSYLAEGTTAYDFTTYLLLQNPNGTEANVAITCRTPEGALFTLPNVRVPGNSRKTVCINELLSSQTDISIEVHSNPQIAVERAMYHRQGAMHTSTGIHAPHRVYYMPDGGQYGDVPAETFTLVQNPWNVEVRIRVSYLTAAGEKNVTFEDTIGAYCRKGYRNWNQTDVGKASVVVECLTTGRSVIAEQSTYAVGIREEGACITGGWGD